MKIRTGHFRKDINKLVSSFNSSIHFDSRLYREDIEGSIAHAEMLGKQGIIAKEDCDKICEGLKKILSDIEAGLITFSEDSEDIHMDIEAVLTERIGDSGKRLHTARSRNDQVAVDMRLYVKRQIQLIHNLCLSLLSTLLEKAQESRSFVMPGYTHLQRAQPTTMAHVLLAYAEMLERDITRLEDAYKRMDECPLGSGALTGTTYNIDRHYTAEKLGFAAVTRNSLDAVSDRDFCIELCAALSALMMHLSRFSEEIILWCSWEYGFAVMDDAYATGSSIMPQKKNPDVAELVRGKTGRVYGSLVTLLTVMKSLPLAYNKDMQEDKEAAFDAIDTVKQCLAVFTPMLKTLIFKEDKMKAAAQYGFINATDCADYLVSKGLPFRDAYRITGDIVELCMEKGKTLETLSISDYKSISESFSDDVFEALDLQNCINRRELPGGPGNAAVEAHFAYCRNFLQEHNNYFGEKKC